MRLVCTMKTGAPYGQRLSRCKCSGSADWAVETEECGQHNAHAAAGEANSAYAGIQDQGEAGP